MENIFTAEVRMQEKKLMKDICCDITLVLGGSDGYREKRSHIRILYLH